MSVVKVFGENENYKPLFTNEYSLCMRAWKGKGYKSFWSWVLS